MESNINVINCKNGRKIVLLILSQHGIRIWSDTLVSFMIRSSVRTCTLGILRNFWKAEIQVFRSTRGSGFSCYPVMVKSQVVLLWRTGSLVSHVRQLKFPFYWLFGTLCVCPSLVVCCIHTIRLLSWACCFVSLGLNNARWAPGF